VLDRIYCSLKKYELACGCLFVFGSLDNQLFNFSNSTGEIIDFETEIIDDISWIQSPEIVSYEILKNENILVHFLGEYDSWAIFSYDGNQFLLKEAGSALTENKYPNEIENDINNQNTLEDEEDFPF
jgi:hypothetical protein